MKPSTSTPGSQCAGFAVGDSVFLRGCRVGEPGRVLRLERGKVVILWQDLDYIGRHSAASLMAAPAVSEKTNRTPTVPHPPVASTSTPTHQPAQEAFPWQQ